MINNISPCDRTGYSRESNVVLPCQCCATVPLHTLTVVCMCQSEIYASSSLLSTALAAWLTCQVNCLEDTELLDMATFFVSCCIIT